MTTNQIDAKAKSTPVTYATLTNNKITIISSTTPYFAVEQHFFYGLMEKYLANVFVDEKWYLETYPDIGDAIKTGAVSGAAEHFRRFGYYEHRMPYQIVVDDPWYIKAYPDVQSGIDVGHFPSGQAHFDTLGYREGRIPYANFALRLKDD